MTIVDKHSFAVTVIWDDKVPLGRLAGVVVKKRGERLIVTGELVPRDFTDKPGEKIKEKELQQLRELDLVEGRVGGEFSKAFLIRTDLKDKAQPLLVYHTTHQKMMTPALEKALYSRWLSRQFPVVCQMLEDDSMAVYDPLTGLYNSADQIYNSRITGGVSHGDGFGGIVVGCGKTGYYVTRKIKFSANPVPKDNIIKTHTIKGMGSFDVIHDGTRMFTEVNAFLASKEAEFLTPRLREGLQHNLPRFAVAVRDTSQRSRTPQSLKKLFEKTFGGEHSGGGSRNR